MGRLWPLFLLFRARFGQTNTCDLLLKVTDSRVSYIRQGEPVALTRKNGTGKSAIGNRTSSLLQ